MVKPITLPGILAAVPGGGVQTLIPQGDGTTIGDMTEGAGLAAAFDGEQIETFANSAKKVSTQEAFVGKDWGASVTHTLTGFKAWGSSNRGFIKGLDPTVTIEAQGSSDNFSVDINDLGNASATDAGSLKIEKLSGLDATTAYRYHRLKITHDGGVNKTIGTGEVEFYETI